MAESGGTQFLKPQDLIKKAEITEGMHVADLGCGNLGYFIIPLAKLVGKNGKAYAVDILKPVLEAVKSRAKLEGISNIETVWTNLEKVGATDIDQSSLDLAMIVNVLYQNKEYAPIIEEASRLLKPAGKLIVVDWKKSGIPFGPPVEQRVDVNEIKNIAANFQLELTEETEVGEYFWGLVFVKR